MNTETIIAELERFQKRFAGGDSKTIDAAVTSLRSLVASNATLRNQRNDTRAEVTKLKAALALGQENCDAEYDELREERDEARAQLAVALTAANAEELRKAQAELARVKAERDEAKEHLDAIDDVMGKIGQRAHWQDCEGLALFFRHTLDLFPKTRNFNDVEQAVAALRQDKERMDWVEDFFARNTERSIIRQQFARDLRSIGFRAAINVAMKEVRHG